MLYVSQLPCCVFCSAGSDMAIFCLLCGKRFQTQTALQQHMEVHAGVRSYICSECNRTFPSHTALKRHLRSHTGKRKQQANHLHYTVVRSLKIQMEALVCCRAAIKTITGKCIFASVWGKENKGHDLQTVTTLCSVPYVDTPNATKI